MRWAWVLGVCLVGLAFVAIVKRPITKAVPLAAVEARPIPQDAAKIVKRRADRLDWSRRTLVGAYDKVGQKDPRWDDQVRVALDLAARMYALEIDPKITPADVHKAVRAALAAGSVDPLLRSIDARTKVFEEADAIESPYRVAAKALAPSGYPAFRKAVAYQYAGSYAMRDREEAGADFDAALDLLGESAATDERNEFWEEAWIDTLKVLIAGYARLGLDAPAAYEKVDARFEKRPDLAFLRLLLRGQFWIDYGWEGRTTGFADTVPIAGFEKLDERLGRAREALEEAYRLRPDDARAPNFLLDIEKAIGGDREEMELWFDRAMKADGDRYSACLTKLDWLDPKWHGTAEEMVAFGRACRDTKNWRVGITLLAADAHHRYATKLPPDQKLAYLGSPGVWADIQAVYDEYLEHFPDNNVARSKYAAFASMAGKTVVAHAQFRILGDRLTTWRDFPYYPMFEMTRMRDATAKRANFWGEGVQVGERWQKATNRNESGFWSVGMPANPQVRQDKRPDGTTLRVLTAVVDGLTYTIRVELAPKADSPLDAALEAILADGGGRVAGEPVATTLGGVEAREFLVERLKNGDVSRHRIAVAGGYLFDLSVTGSKSAISGPEGADMFFGSLRFRD